MNPEAHPHRAPKKNPYKLGWVQSLSLYPALAVLLVTGIYLWLADLDGDPLDLWMLHLHGYATPLFIVSFGALLARHVPTSWKANRNRLSGAAMMAWGGVMIATGFLLYYVGSEMLRSASRQTHFWVGLILVPLIAWHVVAGFLSRKKARKKHKPSHSSS